MRGRGRQRQSRPAPCHSHSHAIADQFAWTSPFLEQSSMVSISEQRITESRLNENSNEGIVNERIGNFTRPDRDILRSIALFRRRSFCRWPHGKRRFGQIRSL